MKFVVAALVASLVAGSAYADDANKHNCQQPPMPNKMASDLVMKSFNKHSETYKKCISDFVAERRAFVEAHSTDVAAAQPAHDAAEAAIVEYNDYIKKLNDRNAAAGAGDDN
jgi:hypothetical protein